MKDEQELFDAAKARMDRRFSAGEAQQKALLEGVVATIIVDKLVAPRSMLFSLDPAGNLLLSYKDQPGRYTIHPHALGQLCLKAELPMSYVRKLQSGDRTDASWERILLTDNLNALFRNPDWTARGGEPTRFLHRIVGTELRGFLSRRFNRHLASAPLLRAFLEETKAQEARPVEALSSPVRNVLKCFLPTIFRAFPGEYICIGVEWSNSDFGSGKLKVAQTLWRVGVGTAAVIDEGLSRAHIGSVIDDSDIEMSEGTAVKEVAAQQSAVRDHVRAYLSEKTVDRLLRAIRAASDAQIPWTSLRSRLRDVLGKGDLDYLQNILDQKGESVIDLPPVSYTPEGTPVPNLYWASSCVGALAAKAEDPDRRFELQREAGRLLAEALEDE
jgi:hypothetical protein